MDTLAQRFSSIIFSSSMSISSGDEWTRKSTINTSTLFVNDLTKDTEDRVITNEKKNEMSQDKSG
jgi:hypothetical protein